MAYRILAADLTPSGYVVKVHLDETKFNQWDEPDPLYVREWTWGREPPDAAIYDKSGMLIPVEKRVPLSEAAYMQSIREMIAEHVAAELAIIAGAAALPGSGQPVKALLIDQGPGVEPPRALMGKEN